MNNNYDEISNYQPMTNSNMEISRYQESGRKRVGQHVHNFFEIYCLLEGKVNFKAEEQQYEIQDGDILLLPPGIKHEEEILSQEYDRIYLWMNPWYLNRMSSRKTNLSNAFVLAEQNGYLFSMDPVAKNQIIGLLKELIYETEEKEFGRDIMVDAVIQRLLILLSRYKRMNLQDEKTNLSGVLRYINQHYTEQITLDFLCEKFFISKFYLSRSFKQITGKSVYQYILEKRMYMARQLLIYGEKPTDIYALCGFRQYSNFYRAFKKYYQMSPGEFLKNRNHN